jgi:hypothetical protein
MSTCEILGHHAVFDAYIGDPEFGPRRGKNGQGAGPPVDDDPVERASPSPRRASCG